MDDISKFQKISNLARELMKHGQSTTMDDAMRKAAQQVESGAADLVSPAVTMQAESLPPVQESFTVSSNVPQDELMREFEKLVGQQQTTLSKMTSIVNVHGEQMRDLSLKIMSMLTDLADLKEQVKNLKENPVVSPPLKNKDAKEGQTQFKPGSEIPSHSVRPQPTTSTAHARSGSYKSEDVSIEKFFYFGNR